MTEIPAHQQRKGPSMGEWIAALLLQARCPDCGEILGDRKNCQFDHDPALHLRDTDDWIGIAPNDPRFIQIRHIDCHKAKSAKETTVRGKVKRIVSKQDVHRQKMAGFKLPSSAAGHYKKKWPSRPFPKKRKDQ